MAPAPDKGDILASRDDISSTEKLLGVIRSRGREGTPSGEAPPSRGARKSRVRSIAARPKRDTLVGVDFNADEMKLVKIRVIPGDQRKLIGYQKIPFDPSTPPGHPEFPSFIRSALTGFCGPSGKVELWCAISSEKSTVKQFLISRVPRKQVANAVYWRLQKEQALGEFDTIFDFNVIGETGQGEDRKLRVAAWTASSEEVQRVSGLFESRGVYTLSGISLGPFALQNLFRSRIIEIDEECVAGLLVGRRHSRIDIFSSDRLVLSRWIRTGLDSMIDCILDAYKSSESPGMQAINKRQAERILFSAGSEPLPLEKGEPGSDLKDVDIYKMILPALQRLVRQLERSIKNYDLNSQNSRVSSIYLFGQLNAYPRLAAYIENQTGLPSRISDPLLPGSGLNTDKTAAPGSIRDRAAFTSAAGMAVSDPVHTPNLLFTSRDREKQEGIKRVNMGIFVVFAAIMCLCMGIFLWQGYSKGVKEDRLAALYNKLERFQPRVDRQYMLQLTEKAKEKQEATKDYAGRYHGMAVIGEISALTPLDVMLQNIDVRLGGIQQDENGSEDRVLILKGIIAAQAGDPQSTLAAYLLRLENSPMFTQPKVKERTEGYAGGKKALEFTIHVQLA